MSAAEQRRYEEIMMIQGYLAEGYAPVQIRELMKTSYARIRRYATGDAYNMCRFSKQGGSQLAQYQTVVIEFLNQNLPMKKILENLTALGYTGKMTVLRDYCRKLINNLQIQYTPKKNTIGVAVNPDQKPDVHYVTRQELFKHLWSGEKLPETDIDSLFKDFTFWTGQD